MLRIPSILHLAVLLIIALPQTALADRLVNEVNLAEIAELLASEPCENRCQTDSWQLARISFPDGYHVPPAAEERLYLATAAPRECGSRGCISAYLLYDTQHLTLIKDGWNVGRSAGLRADEIPLEASRQGTLRVAVAAPLRAEAPAANAEANALLIQAVRLHNRAVEVSAPQRVTVYRTILTLLDRIVTEYPRSLPGLRIARGESLGVLDFDKMRRDVPDPSAGAAVLRARAEVTAAAERSPTRPAQTVQQFVPPSPVPSEGRYQPVDIQGRSRLVDGQLILDWGNDPITGARRLMVLRSGRYSVPCDVTPGVTEGLNVTLSVDANKLLSITSQAEYWPWITAGVGMVQAVCPAIRSCWQVATLGNPLISGSGGMSTRCEVNNHPDIQVFIVQGQFRWNYTAGANSQLMADSILVHATVGYEDGQRVVRYLDDRGLADLRSQIAARAHQEVVERARREAKQRWAEKWDAVLASTAPIENVADIVRHNRVAAIQKLSQGADIFVHFGNAQFQDGAVFFSNRQAWTNTDAGTPAPAFSWEEWNRSRENAVATAFGFSVVCQMNTNEIGGLREGAKYAVSARLISLTSEKVIVRCSSPRLAQ